MDKELGSDSLDSLDSSTDNLEMASTTQPSAGFVPANAYSAHFEVKEKQQNTGQNLTSPVDGKKRLVRLSSKSTMLVSTIITIVVLLITGVTALLLTNNQKEETIGTKLFPSQDVQIEDSGEFAQANMFSGKEQALLVNGDIITNGSLSVKNGGYVAVLKPQTLTANQEYILPNASGTICLSSNNCGFASLDQLSNLQAQLGQIIIPSVPDIPASSLVNNQIGSVNIQGTTNRISVSTSNGTINISTPQDIATISSPTFASLILTGNFNLGGVLDLSLNCSVNANGGSLTTNASGQVICSDDDNIGGSGTVGSPGGTSGTIPVFTAAQTIADSIISQALGTITVAGDLSVSGDVIISSLANGFLSVDGAGLVSVNTIDLGTDTNGNYVLGLSSGNGLSIGGAAGEGWTPTVSLSLQANKGLEVDGNGLSLIDCAIGEILKYNGSAQWICATDSGASGLGDDIYVNGNPLDNANFLDSSASATNADISFTVNAVDPDEITISIGAASATDAGIVTANAQVFGGTKTFNGQIVAISGIDNSNAGITNTGSIAGATTYSGSGLLTNTGGATVSGGTVNLNATGANTTNIANGAATGSTSVGNATGSLTLTGSSASTIVLNGITIDATELNRLDGKDAALVDTNDAVATAITGTGALNSGSITSGFGSIDTGADNITTTGTVTAGTLNVNSENFTDLTGNGLQNSANVLTLLLQANKGLEVDVSGLSLIDCANGELLKYNGSNQWACASDIDTDTDTTYTAGDGLDLTSTTFSVDSPTCAGTDKLTWNGTAFVCASDVDTDTGDDVAVNGVAADDANFLDTSASATNAAITWSLNNLANPDEITLSLGAASGTDAGIVTANAQTIGGSKTFNGQIVAGAGINLGTQTLQGTTAVIDFNNFDVSSTGAITAVGVNAGSGLIQGTGGITASGTITLSSLTNGFLEVNGSGVVSVGTIDLGTDTNGNYVATITPGNGISGSSSTEGGTPTIALSNLTSSWLQSGAFDITLDNASSELNIRGSGGAFYAVLDVAGITSDQTFTFNEGGTVVTSGNVSSHATTGVTAGNGLTGGGTTGVLTLDIGAGNGVTVNANDITIALQASKGLEVDGSGLSLIDCANGELLKYNGSNQWACASDVDTDTGVTTVGAFSGTSIANGASIAGNTITFGPADGTNPGMVSTGTQTFAGDKTFNNAVIVAGLLTGQAGLAISGGAANINTTGTAVTSIGNSTGLLSLISSAGNIFNINGATVTDVEFNRLDGKDAALVDTNDAVATAITGTGALTSGSIASGFGAISTANNITTSANISTTGTGTITSAGLLTASANIQVDGNSLLGNAASDNIDLIGSLATRRGADYTTAGSANDVNFGGASLIRLDTSGAAQTITGVAGGRDGYVLTLVNADAALSATLNNNDSASLAANRITTGTGGNLVIPAGGSISLIYDSSSSLWRTIGGDSGACSTCANQSLSNLSSVNINTALNTTSGDLTLQTTTSGNIVLNGAGIIDLQDNINAAGLISNSAGNVVINDTIDLGSSTTGLRVDAAGVVIDIDGNVVIDDQADIGSATTGIRVATTGSILDIDGDLILNDQVLLGGATGLQITTAGVVTDIDGASVQIGENLSVTAGGIDVVGNSTIATTAGNTLSIGNGTGLLTVTSSAGNVFNINGITVDDTEFNRLDGKDAALVDTNDAVATAITGTGALNSGSITSGFGSIDTGADNITTTGTVTAGTLNVNSENFTDLTGNGLTNAGGVLTVDDTSGTGFFRNGGNSFSGAATLGTNDANVLNIETANTNRFQVSSSASTLTGQGSTTLTSTGSLDLSSAAASGLSVITGTTGTLTLDTGTTGAVNIGTGSNAKAISIGNITGATAVNIYSGTADINLNSQDRVNINALSNVGIIANDTTIQSQNDSATAFQVQNSTAGPLFNVDASTASTTVYSPLDSATAFQVQNSTSSSLFNIDASTGSTTISSPNNSATAFQVLNGSSEQLINVNTTNTVNNLIANPSFEVNDGGWSYTPGYVDTTQSYIGNASLRVDGANGGDGATYDVALASDTTYTLSFYAKAGSENHEAFTSMYVGHYDGTTDVDCLTSQSVSAWGWTRYSCTFTTGTTSGTPNIYMRQNDTVLRAFYIDGVQLLNNTLSSNIISGTNSTFESGVGSWSGYSGSAPTQSSAQAHMGTYSGRIITSGGGGENGVSYSVSGLISPSTTYTMKAYIRADASSMQSTYQFGHTTDSGQVVTSRNGCNVVTAVSSGWRVLTCTFTTASSLRAGPYITITQTNNTSIATTVYIDSVSMYAGTDVGGTDQAFTLGGISLNGAITSPLLLQNSSNSTTAFQIQGANSSSSLLVADTINNRIAVGKTTANYTIDVEGTINSSVSVITPLLTSSAGLTVTGGTTLTLQSTGTNAVSLDSGTTGAVNIGTGGSAKTITVGNAIGATSVVVNCGTGACSFGANATAHPTTLGSVTGAATTTLQGGTGGVSIGTGGIANTIQIGNTTGAVSQTTNIGTNSTASSTNNVNIGSSVAGTTAITGPTTITGRTSGSSAALIVNNSTSTGNILQAQDNATNVLTIANGGAATFQNQTNSTTAFQIQNVAGEQLFKIDTSTTENLLTNGNFEANTTGWAAHGAAGSPSQSTSQHHLGNASMQFTTTAAANDGVKYNYALASQTTYTMTFYVKNGTNTAAVTTISLGRSEDGSTDSDCATSQTISGAGWTKLTCTFTTANVSGTDYIYLKQSDATARTIYVDAVELQTSSSLVINPDFETDISNWNSYGGPTQTQTTAESYTGSGSMQVDTNGIGASEGPSLTSFTGTITANTTYTASYMVKTDAATSGAKTFSILKRFDSVDAGAGTSCGSKSVPVATWTNVTCTFTTGNTIPSGAFISLNVTDDGVTPITFYVDTVNLAVTKYNSNDIGRISLNGAIDSPLTVRGAQDSTSALQVQQQNGKTVLNVDTLNGFVGIGTDAPTKTLQVEGKALIKATSTDTDTFQIQNAATTNTLAFSVAASSRIVAVGASSHTSNSTLNVYGTQLVKTMTSGGSASAFSVQDSSNANILTVSTSTGNKLVYVGEGGIDAKFQIVNTSSTAVLDIDTATTGSFFAAFDDFHIQSSSSADMIFADGTNNRVIVGDADDSSSANTALFVVDSASTANLPTGVNGGIVYDTTTSKLKIYEGGAYKTLCNTTDLGCAAAPTIGAIDSQTKSANGAVISSNTLYLQTADISNPGLVSTGAQTFAGDKTFNNDVEIFGNSINLGNNAADTITATANLKAQTSATGTTGTTTGTGTNATTLTLTTDAFAVGDVVLIDNAGQDYYTRITVDPGTGSYTVSPAVTFETGRTVTKYNVQNVGATATDYSTLSDRFFQGYFLGGIVTGAGSTTLSDGRLQSTGTLNLNASSVAIQNNSDSTTAFQVQNTAGTTLLNADTTNQRISIGTAGTPIGQLYVSGGSITAVGSVATGTNPRSVYVQDKYAYIVNSNDDTLTIYDVSNPSSPASVGSVVTGDNPYAVYVQGHYAYVVNSNDDTLTIYDVSNPSSPASVGSVVTGSAPRSIYVQGRYAYVANNGDYTFGVYDVGNPLNPVAVGSTSTSDQALSVVVQGRYAYVTEVGYLEIIDISSPNTPTVTSTLVMTGVSPMTVAVQGKYAYVANGYSTSKNLQVVDISNPASPSIISTTSLGSEAPQSIVVQGRYVYMTNGSTNTVTIYDVSNPASPVSAGSLGTGTGTPVSIYVQGRYAYVTKLNTSNTLKIYDIGGAYIQQLEVGGIEAGTLSTKSNASVGGNLSIQGGLAVGGSTQLTGDLGVSGQAVFQNATNSTNAFQIQNAAGASLFNIDSANNQITIGGNNSAELTTFTATTSLPAVKQKLSAVTHNGYIYAVGGSVSQTVYYAKVNSDGTLASSWTIASSPLLADRQEIGLAVANGYLYVVGGYDGFNNSDYVSYAKLANDGSVGAWYINGYSLPALRAGASTFVANGYIYAIGGNDNTATATDTVYVARLNADGSTSPWATLSGTPLTQARRFQSVATANGYVYIIGGQDGSNVTQTTTYYAKLNTDGTLGAWGSTSALPAARDKHTTVVANGYIYAMGGELTNGGTRQDSIFYAKLNSDGTLGTWQTATSVLPGVRIDHASVVLNGYIYTIAGNNGSAIDNVHYASTQRIKLGGSLDLTSYSGGNLAEGQTGSGGELTAGNTNIIGDLNVKGNTILSNGLQVVGNSTFTITGDTNTAFTIQNAANDTLLSARNDANGNVIQLDHAYLYLAGVPIPGNPTLSSQGTGGSLTAATYYYRVASYDNAGLTSTSIAPTPASVTTTGSVSRNTIAWTQMPGVAGYYVDRSTDGGVTWYRNDVGNVASIIDNGVTYTWSGSNVDAHGRINYSASAMLESGGALFLDTNGDVYLNKNNSTGDTELINLSGGGTVISSADLQYTDASSFENLFTVSNIGAALFKTETGNNSATAFQIQNASATPMFTVDSTNNRLYVGNTSADSTGTILVLDTKNTSGDPTGVDGAMYYNSDSKSFRCYSNGSWRSCVGGVVFANTSLPGGNTVASTAAETDFASNYTIPANDCQPGRVYKVTAQGVWSNGGGGSNTLRFKAKLGSTTIGDTGANGAAAGVTNEAWRMEFNLICQTTGGSGTIEAQGYLTGWDTVVSSLNWAMKNTGTVTIDTTTSQTLQISVQHDSSSAGKTATLRQFIVEATGP